METCGTPNLVKIGQKFGHFTSPLFCKKKGHNPQNISFTAEARRWCRFTYGKCSDSRISCICLGYSWGWSCHLFTCRTGPTFILLIVTSRPTMHSLHCIIVGHVICTPRVIPQIPHDFKSQPSARVSITVRSSHLSHVIAASMYQRPSVHLGLPTWSRWYPSSDFLLVFWLPDVLRARRGPQEYWHLHRYDCRKHWPTRTSPTCDISLGSLTVAIPEAPRLCGITRNTHRQSRWFITYLNTLYLLTYLLTHSMEQGPSWEANWFCS